MSKRIRQYTRCGRCQSDKPRDCYRLCETCRSRPEWLKNRAEYMRNYRVRNPEKVYARLQHEKTQRKAVIDKYGGKCACCGETTYEFLALDHVRNNGAAHRKADRGAIHLHRLLLKLDVSSDYQVLCHNCNIAKAKYGYCPHARARRVAVSEL